MKKFSFICVAVVAISALLSSCGVASISSYDGVSMTNVVLQKKNFHVVGYAYGQAKQKYILGMGGIRQKALRANAIDEMSRSVQLTGSQALANVTVHKSTKMITPFYMEVICDATANVIEFDE